MKINITIIHNQNTIKMKKIILTLVVIGFMAGSSFGQEAHKKSVDAREDLKQSEKDLVEAKLNLKTAQKDSVSEYQIFRDESELKIKENEKSIADLKVRHSDMDDNDKASYQKKLDKLEQKNTKLKKELTEYDGESEWASFKTRFNHDLDELGKSLTDFIK